MSTSSVGQSAKREGALRPTVARLVRAEIEAIVAPRCSNCAGEVQAGAVRSRGSLFCSIECALAASLPGLYLG